MTDATQRLRGVFTALVSPFTATGAIDWPAFDRLIDRQLEAGIAGLVPVGTTGEAATLEPDEAEALIAHTVRRVAGRAYVLEQGQLVMQGTAAEMLADPKLRQAYLGL